MRLPTPARPAWFAILAALVFLIHAIGYLYFFVDDEGITLVYAESLIEGRGLTYAAAEGPTEGYSNFLHIFTMAGLLALVDLAGLHRVWAFVAGGLFSLACGVALVLLFWHVCRRLGLSTLASTTAALLVALSGPLAVWSNSSLETVPFALAFLALIWTTLPSVRSPWATTVVAAIVMLLRVDGVLFAAVWLGARVLAGDAATRRLVLTRVVPAIAAIGGAYVVWRVWYFGGWLTLPLQTKVAHKLVDADATVVWRDSAGYLLPFIRHAGWPILFGLVTIIAAWFWRNGRRTAVWTCGLAVVVLLAYIGVVGDWMFGFRFAVPLVAPAALLCAYAIAGVQRVLPRVAALVAVAAIAAAASAAVRFEQRYATAQRKPSFWAEPSLDPARRFGEYYEILRTVEPLISPGATIAFHEAGFVPFMLDDVENVDMLGLTSRFVGGLPSRDAVFTDVGRYYPLTREPAHHAVHAYLIHRAPELVIARQTWMRQANHGRLPPAILDGYYGLIAETSSFAVYRRAEGAVPPALEADAFLENVAHPAYASTVAVNGRTIPADDAAEQVPSLWQGRGHAVHVDPRWTLHVDPEADVPVHGLYIEGTPPSDDVSVDVWLRGVDGVAPRRFSAVVRAGTPLMFAQALDGHGPIETIDVRLFSLTGRPVSLVLRAVRVMGQTPKLREHLQEHGVPDAAGPL